MFVWKATHVIELPKLFVFGKDDLCMAVVCCDLYVWNVGESSFGEPSVRIWRYCGHKLLVSTPTLYNVVFDGPRKKRWEHQK